ncbi:MAG: putative phage abortive infection protein [Alkalispirochaeta sp.]
MGYLVFATLAVFSFGFAIVTLFPPVGKWVIGLVSETITGGSEATGETVGGYVGGVTATFIALTTGLILAGTFWLTRQEARREAAESRASQDREHFFRMLDFHRKNVAELHVSRLDDSGRSEGRRAFVVFRIQLYYLNEIVCEALQQSGIDTKDPQNYPWIIDFVYVAFYYGVDRKWPDFIKGKLCMHCPYMSRSEFDLLYARILSLVEGSRYKLGRTNQTSLSAYYRNLYGAVRFVDESEILFDDEKRRLVKMLRGQLSNPELSVFFFNAVSRFGQRWHKYIVKYQLLKNLPFNYVAPYDQRDFFEQDYEEYEHETLRGWSRNSDYPYGKNDQNNLSHLTSPRSIDQIAQKLNRITHWRGQIRTEMS